VKYIILLIFTFIIFSCSKKQNQELENKDEQPALSLVSTYTIKDKIKSIFQKNISDWKELNTLDSFLDRFKKASPNEVLSNALELESLIKNLKDSIKPPLFKTPSFNARVNILYNESLRLSDMTKIPSIKAEEVKEQTNKILNAYSSMNSKINTVLSKKQFEDAIEIDGLLIGLDSTKIDSVSKKAIDLNRKQKFENKLLKKSNPQK
jgi:hypothetical protein